MRSPSILQRVILWMGANALVWQWINPPAYHVEPNGTRLENHIFYLWEIPSEWSVNVPLMVTHLAIIVLFTLALYIVFQPRHSTGTDP